MLVNFKFATNSSTEAGIYILISRPWSSPRFFYVFFLIFFIYNLKVQVYVACLNTRFGRIHAQRITKPAFLYFQHILSFDIIIIIKVLSHQRKNGRSLFTTLWLDDSTPQPVNKILQMLSSKENFIFRNLKNLERLKDTLPITT